MKVYNKKKLINKKKLNQIKACIDWYMPFYISLDIKFSSCALEYNEKLPHFGPQTDSIIP